MKNLQFTKEFLKGNSEALTLLSGEEMEKSDRLAEVSM